MNSICLQNKRELLRMIVAFSASSVKVKACGSLRVLDMDEGGAGQGQLRTLSAIHILT